MRDQLIEALGTLPTTLRRTLTWDRGSEMARHAEVTSALGTLVHFCDRASPWQRASNENANGLLCQSFRKGTDLSAVEAADVRFAADEINSRPRRPPMGQRCRAVRRLRGAGDALEISSHPLIGDRSI